MPFTHIFCHKVALPCFKILQADHWFHVAIYIWALIDQLDSAEMQHVEDENIGDNDLGFLCICKQHAQFIWIRSIICGVPIFPAFIVEHDSIIFDLIDPDTAF